MIDSRKIFAYLAEIGREDAWPAAMAADNPWAFAKVVKWRTQVDAYRQDESRRRVEARKAEHQAALSALERCRAELLGLIAAYRQVCSPVEIEWRWLDALEVLGGTRTDGDVQSEHGASRDCVYQWRRRGLLLLAPDFSPELAEHIRSGRLRRPAAWSQDQAAWRRRNGYKGHQ